MRATEKSFTCGVLESYVIPILTIWKIRAPKGLTCSEKCDHNEGVNTSTASAGLKSGDFDWQDRSSALWDKRDLSRSPVEELIRNEEAPCAPAVPGRLFDGFFAAQDRTRTLPGGTEMDHYGIYMAADEDFFPGVVVDYQALRQHVYSGKLAVIDTGLAPWMRDYLSGLGLVVISMNFTKRVRFTDVLSDENAGMHGWAFKAFGILQANLFERFTCIDADYIPLCNSRIFVKSMTKYGEPTGKRAIPPVTYGEKYG